MRPAQQRGAVRRSAAQRGAAQRQARRGALSSLFLRAGVALRADHPRDAGAARERDGPCTAAQHGGDTGAEGVRLGALPPDRGLAGQDVLRRTRRAQPPRHASVHCVASAFTAARGARTTDNALACVANCAGIRRRHEGAPAEPARVMCVIALMLLPLSPPPPPPPPRYHHDSRATWVRVCALVVPVQLWPARLPPYHHPGCLP